MDEAQNDQAVAPTADYVTSPEGHEKIDTFVAAMKAAMEDGTMVPLDMTPENFFTPGLYLRKLRMQARSLWVSKIHQERHPYFVLSGRARVWIDGTGWQLIEAPFHGFTDPGTRRILWIEEDMVWITVHHNPTNTQDLEEIESRIIEARALPDAMSNEQFDHLLTSLKAMEALP